MLFAEGEGFLLLRDLIFASLKLNRSSEATDFRFILPRRRESSVQIHAYIIAPKNHLARRWFSDAAEGRD